MFCLFWMKESKRTRDILYHIKVNRRKCQIVLSLCKPSGAGWTMTRNVMFNFLQNLTTSKKQQQLQTSNTTRKSSDGILFGVSKSHKSKSKCEFAVDDAIICKAVNGKSKKKSSIKSKFFLRKSRWVFAASNSKLDNVLWQGERDSVNIQWKCLISPQRLFSLKCVSYSFFWVWK